MKVISRQGEDEYGFKKGTTEHTTRKSLIKRKGVPSVYRIQLRVAAGRGYRKVTIEMDVHDVLHILGTFITGEEQ